MGILHSLVKDIIIGKHIGFIFSVGDGVAKAIGLRGVIFNEVVYFLSSNIKKLIFKKWQIFYLL